MSAFGLSDRNTPRCDFDPMSPSVCPGAGCDCADCAASRAAGTAEPDACIYCSAPTHPGDYYCGNQCAINAEADRW